MARQWLDIQVHGIARGNPPPPARKSPGTTRNPTSAGCASTQTDPAAPLPSRDQRIARLTNASRISRRSCNKTWSATGPRAMHNPQQKSRQQQTNRRLRVNPGVPHAVRIKIGHRDRQPGQARNTAHPDQNVTLRKQVAHRPAAAARPYQALWRQGAAVCELFQPDECQNYVFVAGNGSN